MRAGANGKILAKDGSGLRPSVTRLVTDLFLPGVQDKIAQAMQQPPVRLKAKTHLGYPKDRSFSQPLKIQASDRANYFVKPMRVNRLDQLRGMFNDQVIARLGVALGARVGAPAIVELGEDFVDQLKSTIGNGPDPQNLFHLEPGPAHATKMLPSRIGKTRGQFDHVDANRENAALYAVLAGWCHVDDDQHFIYADVNGERHIVCVDHGHYFPSGPEWTVGDLGRADAAVVDAVWMNWGQIGLSELDPAFDALRSLDESAIIDAVASPPDNWGVEIHERAALAGYLINRRKQLLQIAERGRP